MYIPFVSYLSTFKSMRTSMIEPRLFSMRSRESMWNVCPHPGDNYLFNALSIHRGVSVLEAMIIIIPRAKESSRDPRLHGLGRSRSRIPPWSLEKPLYSLDPTILWHFSPCPTMMHLYNLTVNATFQFYTV